jgi:acetyl-CoA acetyltransferase
MGNTAENVARQWQITREEQDKFATAFWMVRVEMASGARRR